MRIGSWVLAVATIALMLPVVSAMPTVGGGEHTVTVPGRDVTYSTPTAVEGTPQTPGASGHVTVDDVHVKVTDPTCRYKGRLETNACSQANLETNAPNAAVLGYAVNLNFGHVEDAATAGNSAAPVSIQGAPGSALDGARTVAIAAATASAAGLGVYLIWRGLKLLGMAGLIPLYSHISDDELLNDENRSRIFALIKSEPGVSTKEIATRFDLAWGTVTHHLAKLEKRQFIVSKKFGKYRRYFANGEGGSQEKETVAVLKVARTSDIVDFIREHPGSTQKEVSAVMGVSSSTILWHVKRLEAVGLVNKVRDGKTVRYTTPVAAPAPAPGTTTFVRASAFQP